MHHGDEAITKIHKKLFSGIPINFTLFVISPKPQRIWSWNFGFTIRKKWAFIWNQKIYYFRLSPGGWECDRHNYSCTFLIKSLPVNQSKFQGYPRAKKYSLTKITPHLEQLWSRWWLIHNANPNYSINFKDIWPERLFFLPTIMIFIIS